MKCLRLLAIVLTLCIGTLRAQDKGDIELGINGGVNIAGIIDNIFSSDTRTSFNIGATGDFYFSDRWSLKTKIIYDQKGYKTGYLIYNGKTIIEQSTYNLNYITVPVMANWHFGKKRNWYLHFGPYIGVLTDTKSTSVKSDFNSLDAGIALGIGVKIPLSEKCKLFLEYDEQGSLTNIYKGEHNSSTRNLRIGFNAGICFPIK